MLYRLLLLWSLCIVTPKAQSQSLYFPPLTGDTWETLSPESLNWCPDSLQALINYVGSNNSKGFLILKDGKMVSENYYGTFTRDSFWYWASAGKSLTAFLIGQAQEEGLLDIQNPSSQYQGAGWTSCTPEQEQNITVWNQLTMTTGLDYSTGDIDCTDPACLQYLAEPGTQWYYHNAPYTRLDAVIEGASGLSFNQFYNSRLRNRIGMNGLYLPSGYNNVNYSNTRSLARFGLLILNRGIWANDTLMHDTSYFDAMVNTSQSLNESYGYLWWLNGKSSFMLPSLTTVFPGMLMPDAPADMVCAVGKNGQYILVIPSQNMVVVRVGNDAPGITGLVPTILANEIMKRIARMECLPTALHATPSAPAHPYRMVGRQLWYDGSDNPQAQLFDGSGRLVCTTQTQQTDLSSLPSGIYILRHAQGSMKLCIP